MARTAQAARDVPRAHAQVPAAGGVQDGDAPHAAAGPRAGPLLRHERQGVLQVPPGRYVSI